MSFLYLKKNTILIITNKIPASKKIDFHSLVFKDYIISS